MTDTMLERMARAIDPDEWEDFSLEPPIVQRRAAAKREATIEAAKAALQAIREPSEACMDAAYKTPHEDWEPAYFGDVHTTIIDAILSGEV